MSFTEQTKQAIQTLKTNYNFLNTEEHSGFFWIDSLYDSTAIDNNPQSGSDPRGIRFSMLLATTREEWESILRESETHYKTILIPEAKSLDLKAKDIETEIKKIPIVNDPSEWEKKLRGKLNDKLNKLHNEVLRCHEPVAQIRAGRQVLKIIDRK